MKTLHPLPETSQPSSQTIVWVLAFGIVALFGFISAFVVVSNALAQSPTSTPSGNDAHHPTATPGAANTSTPTSDGMGMNMGTPTATPDMGTEMSPIDPGNALAAPVDSKRGQRLEPKLANGVKEFTLTVQKVRWHILPDVEVVAYPYNGTVPGPEIRISEGDRVRILVTNSLDEPTVVHWYGMQIPNVQYGAADVTQPPIKPSETFT